MNLCMSLLSSGGVSGSAAGFEPCAGVDGIMKILGKVSQVEGRFKWNAPTLADHSILGEWPTVMHVQIWTAARDKDPDVGGQAKLWLGIGPR